MGFLEKNASDPVVAAAILTAPSFLSGLNGVGFSNANIVDARR